MNLSFRHYWASQNIPLVSVLACLAGIFAPLPPIQAAASKVDIPAEYGGRMHYLDGPLKYPNFTIRFVKREDHYLARTRLSSTSYTFEVLNDKNVKLSSFDFTMSGLFDNTSEFQADGKKYVAEMFYSTGRPPKAEGKSAVGNVNLTDKEIIVWDEATAKRGNPDLRKFWKKGFKPGPR